MDVQNAWSVASKDFEIFKRRRGIIYTTVAVPLGIGVGFPAILAVITQFSGAPVSASDVPFLDAFSFWFVIGAATLPGGIASYSIAGEKIQKSLEPLLATPMQDSEILLGKSIASFVPPIASIWAGSAVFMVLMDLLTRPGLGYAYYPNWGFAVIILVLAPLASILTIELTVIVSTRANDLRTVQQFTGFLAFPFFLIYLATEIGVFRLDTGNLLIVSAIFLFVDLVLFRLCTSAFNREEILTKWK